MEIFIKGENKSGKFKNFLKRLRKPFKFMDYIFKIILILIILFLILELFASLASFFYNKINKSGGEKLFEEQWYHEFNAEFEEAFVMEYSPYMVYKKIPNYHGKYINLNNDSLRETTKCLLLSPIKIFVFGGSTTFGERVSDNETIPSYLSDYLCERNIAVEVTNFGEEGYVNTQETIRLLLELRNGNYPDIVIFYNGMNDVVAAYQSEPGMPQNLIDRKMDYGSRNKLNVVNFLLNSKFIRIINGIIRKSFVRPENKEIQAEKIISVLSGNQRIVKSLEEDYGFKSFFYWQPSLYTKSTKSEIEKQILSFHQGYADMGKAHNLVTNEIKNKSEFIDLSEAFDDYNESIYFDPWHVTKKGNKVIAEKIGEDIINFLENK